MPLYIIGLGLGDERDITVKGADAIRKCDRVFLESYTSVLAVPAERLEEMYGKKVEIAYRETVESEAEKILEPAKTGSVAFLVVGDPFGCGRDATSAASRAMRAPISANRRLAAAVRLLQRHHPHGPPYPRPGAGHRDAHRPQRVHHERGGVLRPAALLLRADGLHPLLHGDVAPRLLLPEDRVQRRRRHAHAVPAR